MAHQPLLFHHGVDGNGELWYSIWNGSRWVRDAYKVIMSDVECFSLGVREASAMQDTNNLNTCAPYT